MQVKKNEPPREFKVGINSDITIKDMGEIRLKSNEQITFITDDCAKYDFARKDWGFYATPSINSRLKNEGFKTALVKNKDDRLYIMAVEKGKRHLFDLYCEKEKQKVVEWLDEANCF